MAEPKELVVVIHGFAGKRLWMFPLTRSLGHRFEVVNWSYFSFGGSIRDHGKRFFKFLLAHERYSRIHVVAHSMGCIVTRSALQCGTIENLARVVLLAPPNRGSQVAKMADPFLGWICRPIRELSASPDSFVNSLAKVVPCETGVIAAKYDLLVPLSSTYLPNLKGHVAILGTHNSLLFSRKTNRMIQVFLQTGSFAA